MYLHGFSDPQIAEYDTLTSEERWHESADVVLANPPFMTPKGGIRPHKRFSIQAKRSEVLFVDYIAEHLNPGGRAGVIVPEGIIFQSQNAYKNLRKMLVENYLWAVVSLPAGVFNPYSGVKTSILLMDKSLAKKTDRILFVKIGSDGFDLGAQRRLIEKNDLPPALAFMKGYRQSVMNGSVVEETDFAHVVEKTKIAESGDWNLSGERYRDANELITSDYKLVELGKVFNKISESINPKKHSGEIKYVGLENIESNTGKNRGDTTTEISSLKSQKTKFEKDDILYGKLRPNLNKVYLAEMPGICSTDVYVLRCHNSGIIPKFYSTLLRSKRFNVEVLKGLSGAQLPRVSWGYFSSLKIPLPPLDVQKAIVAEIDGYQKIIDGAPQVVDNYKPTIKIDPSWEMVELGKLAQNLDGKRIPISKSERKTGQYPYYGASGIVDYVHDYLFDEDLLLISEDGANLLARVTPIAFSVSGKCWVNNHTHVLKFQNIATQIFVETYLNSIRLENYVTGSAQPKLNQAKLNSIPIPFPSLNLQQEIVAQIEAEQEMVHANKKLIEIFEQKIKNKIS